MIKEVFATLDLLQMNYEQKQRDNSMRLTVDDVEALLSCD